MVINRIKCEPTSTNSGHKMKITRQQRSVQWRFFTGPPETSFSDPFSNFCSDFSSSFLEAQQQQPPMDARAPARPEPKPLETATRWSHSLPPSYRLNVDV